MLFPYFTTSKYECDLTDFDREDSSHSASSYAQYPYSSLCWLILPILSTHSNPTPLNCPTFLIFSFYLSDYISLLLPPPPPPPHPFHALDTTVILFIYLFTSALLFYSPRVEICLHRFLSSFEMEEGKSGIEQREFIELKSLTYAWPCSKVIGYFLF